MTLELSKVAAQVGQMGASAAQRVQERNSLLPVVRGYLSDYASDPELRAKIDLALDAGWFGAVPTDEAIDSSFDPPALPARLNVVASDGSQVYPDRHAAALYYVINVGSIALRLGSGETPRADTTPTVCFDEEHLFGDGEQLVSSQLVSARRAVAEITQLSQVAVEEAGTAATLALLDGSLALNTQHETIPRAERERLLDSYIARLDALKAARVPVAGFISRSGTTSVAKLLELGAYPLGEVEARVKNQRGRPFGGLIIDTRLFETLLQPGQRSAIFELRQGWNRMYRDAGHAIHVFYVNVGGPTRPSIARVEVPAWVAQAASRLGLAHAAILDQCHVTENAYPYVLTRADELAVITTAEKNRFEQMIGVELLRHGIAAGPSEKAATKAFARYGKGR
jgi:hypothetical protein